MSFSTYLTNIQKAQSSPLKAAKKFLAQGMRNQQLLARIAAENYTNAKTTSIEPGGDPYRRKVVSFKTMVDKKSGIPLLTPEKITRDSSDFKIVYKPFHPAADAKGYVKLPNIEPAIEMMDFREANQSTDSMAHLYALVSSMDNRNHDLMKRA